MRQRRLKKQLSGSVWSFKKRQEKGDTKIVTIITGGAGKGSRIPINQCSMS